jgi:hypothetical protein
MTVSSASEDRRPKLGHISGKSLKHNPKRMGPKRVPSGIPVPNVRDPLNITQTMTGTVLTKVTFRVLKLQFRE